MSIYISGPIAGYPAFKEVFESAAKHLRFLRFDVVNPVDVPPHEHEGECPKSYVTANGHSAACYLRTDLKALLDCDAIFMLSGWENSIGARLEHSVAAHCGLKIYYAGENNRIDRKGK
jgi:hypothetical protein